MFRDRPLTWLFVIATVCVDLVWLATTSEDDFGINTAFGSSLFFRFCAVGCFLAQSCVFAIQTIFAVSRKLTQASILVAGNFSLAFVSYPGFVYETGSWHTYFFLHAIQVIAVTSIARLLQIRRDKQPMVGVWQISLIEMFGWTTVVAIVSYGFRYMDFSDLNLTSCMVIAFPSIALNLATIWGLSTRSRVSRALRAASPFFVAFIVIVLLDIFILAGSPGLEQALALFGAYAGYLCAWVVIRGIDLGNKSFGKKRTHV